MEEHTMGRDVIEMEGSMEEHNICRGVIEVEGGTCVVLYVNWGLG